MGRVGTMKLVKFAAALLLCAAVLAQSPTKVEYTCPPEDIDSFGLACASDDPCSVFLELSSIEAVGDKLFVAGDLHTESITLYGVLLASEDGGKNWSEPLKRLRAAALEQIQFIDLAKGWISGQAIEPLPRDPFLLVTDDGGGTWRQKMLFDDSRFGSIAQFWFASREAGELVLDRAVGGHVIHELYRTATSGESWELEQSATKAVPLKRKTDPAWRLRADGKSYYAQRRASAEWQTVASFPIAVAECK
jgi:photosystem II stability/assembly factor-like uncharacterized protein